MSQIILFCILVYLIVGAVVMMLIWAALVLGRQDDMTRGIDLLEGRELNWNQEKAL